METFQTEEEVKKQITKYYEDNGYRTQTAWDHIHGADIVAQKDTTKIIVEAKGSGSRNPMRVNYFLSILGETLQRMNEPNCKYYIAFPDLKQYRDLWMRLPNLAKQRTDTKMILVDKDGNLSFWD